MDDFALFLDSRQPVGAICLSNARLAEARRRSRWHAICWDEPPHAAPAQRALRWRVGIDLPRAILG